MALFSKSSDEDMTGGLQSFLSTTLKHLRSFFREVPYFRWRSIWCFASGATPLCSSGRTCPIPADNPISGKRYTDTSGHRTCLIPWGTISCITETYSVRNFPRSNRCMLQSNGLNGLFPLGNRKFLPRYIIVPNGAFYRNIAKSPLSRKPFSGSAVKR